MTDTEETAETSGTAEKKENNSLGLPDSGGDFVVDIPDRSSGAHPAH